MMYTMDDLQALGERELIQLVLDLQAEIGMLCPHNNYNEYFDKCDDCGLTLEQIEVNK
jgi:hypothetical protein